MNFCLRCKADSQLEFILKKKSLIIRILYLIFPQIRIWLHIPAVMQHIIPFRTYVIRWVYTQFLALNM